MTESHPPHPTDEALSAAIDGHDEDGSAAHAEGCERCRYRMEAMRGVSSLLAVPPPVDEMARERAIAQAVRVRPEPAGARRWGAVVGAAAAVLLAALLVPLLLSTGSDDSDKAATRIDETAGEESATGAGGTSELGSFDDPAALRNALAGLLGEDVAFGADAASSKDAAPASTTTAPPPAAATGARALDQAGGGPACSGDVRRDYGERVGSLLYSGELTWSGQRSVVLVYAFKEPQGSLDKLALVLRQSDCQLLTSVSL